MVHSPFQPGDPRTPNNPFYAKVTHTPRLRRFDRNMRFFREGLFADAPDRGFESEFDTPIDGIPAAMITDFSGVVSGQYWDGVSNTLKFADLLTYTIGSLATQVDSDGFIKFAPHNLALRSNDFDTIWTKQRSVVSGTKTVGPDGVADSGWELRDDGNTGEGTVFVSQTFTVVNSSSYRFYVFAEQHTNSWVAIRTSGFTTPADATSYFDLGNGIKGSEGASHTAIMEDAGNGWFLCAIEVTTDASDVSGSFVVHVADANLDNTITRDGTHAIYISSSGLYQTPMADANDTFADTYVPTTTAAVFQHRLDHDPVTLARTGLLIEEERTNIAPQSNDFDTTWIDQNNTAFGPRVTGPDGELSGWEFRVGTGGGTAETSLQVTRTVELTTTYTLSIWAKAGSVDWIKLRAVSFSIPSNSVAYFDLANGVVGTVDVGFDAGIEDWGNGWFRCWVTFTTGGADSVGNIRFDVADAFDSIQVEQDGVAFINLANAQFEEGTFPSSYIPTKDTSVTRTAELCTVLVSAFAWGGDIGGIAAKAGGDPAVLGRNNAYICGTNSAASDLIYRSVATDNAARIDTGKLLTSFAAANSVFSTTALKIAASWNATSTKIALDGNAIGTATGPADTGGVTFLRIGSGASSNRIWNSHIDYISIYAPDVILSDADVEGLTAPTTRTDESGVTRLLEDGTTRTQEG